MPSGQRCCIINCQEKSHRRDGSKIENGLSFYGIPKVKENAGEQMKDVTRRRRMAWISAIRRPDVTFENATYGFRVCSKHFHKGTPSYEMMDSDPDWAPSLHLGHKEVTPTNTGRYERRQRGSEIYKCSYTPTDMETDFTTMSSAAADVVDVDDDDIVFMDAETAEQSLAAKLPSLEAISQAVQETKAQVEMSEHELALIQEELSKSEKELGKEVFRSLQEFLGNPSGQVSINISEQQLDQIITGALESIPSNLWDIPEDEFNKISAQLDAIDDTNQQISKTFLDCHTSLKEFRAQQTQEIFELDKILAKLTTASNVKDDVSITNSTGPVSTQQPGSRGWGSKPPSSPSAKQTSSAGSNSSLPSLNTLRSHYANTINQAMPALVSSLQNQQSHLANRPAFQGLPGTSAAHQPIHWPVLKIQDKVLGKKFNDVWYSGTIMDIAEADPQTNFEWRCRVKFDGKGMKWLSGMHVAYRDPINCFIRHGTRVVALYREDDAPNTFYAGVIAEAPSLKNNRRFLVFFDDGYAQYCEARELHKVYVQSANVWEDINPETSAFIKEYLRIYPERPMVRLSRGQVVKTEWNGKWWTGKVVETDASLVKMYFQADKRTEWIYRGSTRLEPLFKALANADAIKAAGSARGRRHNLMPQRFSQAQPRPSVEYTRGLGFEETSQASSTTTGQSSSSSKSSMAAASKTGQENSNAATAPPKKKANVAKKSTTQASTNTSTSSSVNNQKKASSNLTQTSEGTQKSKPSKDMASVLQDRLASNQVEYDGEIATGERREVKIEYKPRVKFQPHTCSKACLQGVIDDPAKMKARNAMLIPLLYGWERQIGKARPAFKRIVRYRTPCGRHLRNIQETDKYLAMTDSLLTIDLFSFDQHLHVNSEFVPLKTFCDIKDLSYGRENYPISCVNGVDRLYPDYVEYSHYRIPTKQVDLNTDTNFLVCCDCTDNCRDRSKCACQQLTIENTTWIGERNNNAGYHHRRLKEPLFTGIVECNEKCKCDKRCANKVVQHGLNMRLQVFKTEKKGWGLRCLDDIAKGSFICIYAGQLLTDREANEDGKQYGDQYLAELDFIEVVERQKEGYESDVEDMNFSDDDTKDENYKASKDSEDSDGDYNPQESARTLRKRKKDKDEAEEAKTENAKTSKEANSDEDYDDTKDEKHGTRKARAKKSTGGSRMNPSVSMKPSQESLSEKNKEEKKERQPTRSFFNDDTECYIMDAKSVGNLGRYLNHSCNPNVFVQNIFVDTHDLRFPWVTFWAGQYIRAGTELTWDYNYEVGSVPDRVLYCYCRSSVCRGRLL